MTSILFFICFLYLFIKCGHLVLPGCLAWLGCVLTLVGLGCHCRWLSWASGLLLNHHDFTKQRRSEVGVRLTTVLLKAPTSHAFREMKFILRQLSRILAVLEILGGPLPPPHPSAV